MWVVYITFAFNYGYERLLKCPVYSVSGSVNWYHVIRFQTFLREKNPKTNYMVLIFWNRKIFRFEMEYKATRRRPRFLLAAAASVFNRSISQQCSNQFKGNETLKPLYSLISFRATVNRFSFLHTYNVIKTLYSCIEFIQKKIHMGIYRI